MAFKPLSDVSTLPSRWGIFGASSSVFHLPCGRGLAPLLILSPQCSSWLSPSTQEACHLHLKLSSFHVDPAPFPSPLLCLLGSILVSRIITCQSNMLAPSELSSPPLFSLFYPFSGPYNGSIPKLPFTPLSAFWIATTQLGGCADGAPHTEQPPTRANAGLCCRRHHRRRRPGRVTKEGRKEARRSRPRSR